MAYIGVGPNTNPPIDKDGANEGSALIYDSASSTFIIGGHDDLKDYVADEHVAHSGVTMTAGSGLTGGGDITTTRTFNIGEGIGITVSADAIATNDAEIVHDNLSGFVANEHINHTSVTMTAGVGLTGGGDISASRTFNIGAGAGITVSADAIATNDAEIVHDNLSGFVADEHIAHSGVTLTAGTGLNGGGTIAASRTFNIDSAELYASFDHDGFNDYVANEHIDHTSVSVTAGSGLTGGGTIAASRTFNIGQGTGITVSADAIATNDAEIVHDNLSGFVADEHVAHSTVSITAGSGLTGGGTIAATRTLNIGEGTGITVSADAISTNDGEIVHDNLSGFVADEHVAHSGVTMTAGAGLTGGGTIAATRTFNVGAGTGVTVNANDIAIGQDVATTADVTFNSITTTDGLIIGGDLQVTGTTTTVNSQSLEVTDNMIYMNAGESDGSPTQSIDVGWAANVNDGGSYTHVGMFRDATDDRFKVYGAYTPEPDAALEINTGHASFALADFQAATFYGNLTGAVTGNASTATALETARTIGGVSFNGTSNINLPGVNTTGNQNTSGNAATATKLATARTIGLSGDVTATGVSFDGTGNITLTTAMASNSVDLTTHTTGNYVASITNGSYITGANGGSEGAGLTLAVDATSNNVGSKVVARDASGNFAANQVEADLVGNASTATTLATGRTISLGGDLSGSASFNGSTNITISAQVADNSHSHTIANVTGLQTALDTKWGKGADIPGSANLNSYTTDGYYHQNSNSSAASGSNYPVSLAGMLEVTADGSMVYQRYTVYNSTHTVYVRTYYNGSWYSWAKQWDDRNDGAGSGLDADLLDGQQGSYYYPASNPNGYTSYSNSSVDAHLNRSTATTDQVLSWSGSDYNWVDASGGISFVRKTTTYTAAANEGIIADTSSGAWTLSLPSSPADGTQVIVGDGGSWAANNLTINRNGSTIEGVADNYLLDVSGAQVQFIYVGSTWQVYSNPGVVNSTDSISIINSSGTTLKTIYSA